MGSGVEVSSLQALVFRAFPVSGSSSVFVFGREFSGLDWGSGSDVGSDEGFRTFVWGAGAGPESLLGFRFGLEFGGWVLTL